MKLQSLQDLLLSELQDLLGGEQLMLKYFPKWIQDSTHSELKKCLENHFEDTKLQEARLMRCFHRMGEPADGGRNHGMIGMISRWQEIEESECQPDVRDAALISAIQHMKHYEVAGYGCARAFAEAVELEEVAELLQESLREEEECDRELTRLAESQINVDAEARAS
jgi:ferritin-like metal-binding protein YciE